MGLFEKLRVINGRITDLTKQRDNLLGKLRKQCKHLHLVELTASPSQRICVDCGAEERGWYCGYHVLVMRDDGHFTPYKQNRVLLQITTSSEVFDSFRKDGPLYLVGQSHPNFKGGGVRNYKQLTEVIE